MKQMTPFQQRWLIYGWVSLFTILLATLLEKPEYLWMLGIGWLGFLNVEWMVYLTRTSYAPMVQKLYNHCYLTCQHPICQTLLKLRGDDYFLTFGDSTTKTRVKTCLVSLWNVLHFVLFFILGRVVPNVFWEVVVVSIIYEYAEYKLYNCHDAMDILWNISGYLAGVFIGERV